jgi:hypothetical protein
MSNGNSPIAQLGEADKDKALLCPDERLAAALQAGRANDL